MNNRPPKPLKPNAEAIRINPAAVIVPKRPVIWDCGSTLYDSFELKSFERQLESALTRTNSSGSSSKLIQQHELDLGPKPGRTQSMPHLSFFNTRRALNFNADHMNSSPVSSTSSEPVKNKKKKLKSRSIFTQLLRSVFSRSKSSHNSPHAKEPKHKKESVQYYYNEDLENDEKEIRSSTRSSGKWFQLVYEDEDHLVYEKDKSSKKGNDIATLSTIPELPEVFTPPPHNINDEKINHPSRRRRWSSSSLMVSRETMSDRFTGRFSSHELI